MIIIARKALILTSCAALTFLSACGTDPGHRALTGGGIGAGAGVGAAILGAPLIPAMVVGGAVGAATGALTSPKKINLDK